MGQLHFGGAEVQEDDDKISSESGQALVQLARRTILQHLGRDIDAAPGDWDKLLAGQELQARRGVFVTLHQDGQLRGCIGNLAAGSAIVEGVKDNAINAACQDHRFQPLSADEVDGISIEVSILTDPKPLAYDGGPDLVKKLRINIDGVIIRYASHSATFLPQVWEQLPEPAAFLSHLCQKAGLAPDVWQGGDLEVMIYQVQHFDEGK